MTDIRINLNQIETDDINTSVFASKNEVNLVQDNVQSLDNNVWVNANDFTTYSTVTANTYNTYTDLSANDYSTYNTLSSLIDTVQDNVSSQSSNTSIVAGGTDLSNTTVFIEAGDGVLLSSNTTSKTMTIATSMSNVTSQTISIDGTANSFTLTKSAANANMILVMYNGLVQDPSRYTISGTTLTLNNVAPIIAGANVEVRYFDFFSLPGVSTSSGGGYSFQGENFGYVSGGNTNYNINYDLVDTIEKFSFTSDSNGVDVGELTQVRKWLMGHSSDVSGYASGGQYSSPIYSRTSTIDKFPFSSDSSATDIGDLAGGRILSSSHSSSINGYVTGGYTSSIELDTIEKFPFSSDSNATDIGELTATSQSAASQSSTDNGYRSGGYSITEDSELDTIEKFSFSSDSSATGVGNLTQARSRASSQSSGTSGYVSGGFSGSFLSTIDKFPFSSDSNSTDVGDLTSGYYGAAGQSSTVSGYHTGGKSAPTVIISVIQNFPFSSDTNATGVANLSVERAISAGHQV